MLSLQEQPSTSSAYPSTLPSLPKPPSFCSTYSTVFPSNAFEIVNLKKNLSSHYELIKVVEIQNCPTTLDASKLISNSTFRSALESMKNFIILKLRIDEKINNEHAEKPRIYEFKIDRNFLISFESSNSNHKIIYWQNSNRFITLRLMEGYSTEMTDFVRDLLIEIVNEKIKVSLQTNHMEVTDLIDSNGYNLLLKAVNEEELLTLIDEILLLPFDINQKCNKGQSAADIAWKLRNFEILLKLLDANSKFPNDFHIDELDFDDASKQIEKFIETCNLMHKAINAKSPTQIQKIIKEIINNKPNLKYFYNLRNVSAATTAINAKKIDIYRNLLNNGCSTGPEENFNEFRNQVCEKDEVFESATKKRKLAITSLHDDASIELPEKHLRILYANSLISHDNQFARQRSKKIKEVYRILNNIDPITRQILQLASMHCNFKIRFDFNRSSVEFMNPSGGDETTHGLYEDFDGIKRASLYIAAKELLLSDDEKFAAIGTLAHELCHFVINLTFCNDGKPYGIDDVINEMRFQEIIEEEEIRLKIFKYLKKIKKFEELTLFCKNVIQSPDQINDIKIDCEWKLSYQKIRNRSLNEEFDIFERRVKMFVEENLCQHEESKEMIEFNNETLIPFKIEFKEIRAKFWENEECIDKLNEMIQILTKNYNFEALIEEYQSKISENDDEIRQLVNNSDCRRIVSLVFTCYPSHLWPAELIVRVPHMIAQYQNDAKKSKAKFKDLFDYYDDVVVPKMNQTMAMLKKLFNKSNEIKFNDLTDAYKSKIHHANVKFQGIDVKLNEIIVDKNSEIFQHLSSKQICEILIENEDLSIGCAQVIKAQFYVERDFIDFDTETKGFTEISSIAHHTKMILLSDHAGAGKTTTFKHLSVKLKKTFPYFWISYIDLKKHLKVYEKCEQNFIENQVLKVLKEILLITDKFQAEIFTKLFNSDRVILLYDGVDEIAPKFKDFFIGFIESVRNSTKNQQWIATRPQHIQELREKFNQKAYELLPFNEDAIIKSIENVLKSIKVENVKAEDVLNYINKMTSYENKIDSPLMLQMMIELYANDKVILKDSNNYSLYDRMIEMKKDLIIDKGEIANENRDNRKAKLTIWQVHQIYSLKLIYKDGFEDYLNESKMIDINEFQLLKRWKKENSNWTPEAISRYGFLIVDHWNTDDEFPDFVHRSFAEFFIAQFLIQELYELNEDGDDEMSEKEIELRVKLLIQISYEYVINEFISNFIDNHKLKRMHKHFFKLITSDEMQKILVDSKSVPNNNIVKIFSIDERYLKEFRFDDNKTIFQYWLNHISFYDIPKAIDIYKRCFGVDWINHTGYSLNPNFSMPNYKNIDEILRQKSNYLYSNLGVLNLIDQFNLPQKDILKFFSKSFYSISGETFKTSLLSQKLFEMIQNNFYNCKSEFLRIRKIKKIRYAPLYDDKSDHNAKEFIRKLEEFLQSDDKICNDDLKIFVSNLNLCFFGIESLVISYREKEFTKTYIQQFFKKQLAYVIDYIIKTSYYKLVEYFMTFFEEIFDVQSEGNQFKEYLETRFECYDEDYNNHTILSYLKKNILLLKLHAGKRQKFKLFYNTLLKMAKQIEMTDDEIKKLSKRENDDDSSSE